MILSAFSPKGVGGGGGDWTEMSLVVQTTVGYLCSKQLVSLWTVRLALSVVVFSHDDASSAPG